MKKILSTVLCVLLLVAMAVSVHAQGTDEYPITMRVVNCQEWVSLRGEPSTGSEKLAEVPLGALVDNCIPYNKEFISCEYDGQSGYILARYLEPASETWNGKTLNEYIRMTEAEILSHGESILDEDLNGVRILATCENDCQLRLGVFVDSEPVWGYLSTAREPGQTSGVTAFVGGTVQNPQIMVYNIETGLSMLELWNGEVQWTIPPEVCSFGAANAVAVSDDGIVYIGGWDGPDPIAVSSDGKILWKSSVDNDDVYWLYRIELNMDEIDAYYEGGYDGNGTLVTMEYTGEIISTGPIPAGAQ